MRMPFFTPSPRDISCAVIFGSTAKHGKHCNCWPDPKPRNLNVAYCGDFSEFQVIKAAEYWIIDHNLPRDLPIEAHRVYPDMDGTIELYVPPGLKGHHLTLLGHAPKVRWLECVSLSALLRLSRVHVSAAYGRIAAGLQYGGLQINLRQNPGQDWEYKSKDGLRALANGLRYADASFLQKLGEFGEFLSTLKGFESRLQEHIRPEALESDRPQGGIWYFEKKDLDAPTVAYQRAFEERIALVSLLGRILTHYDYHARKREEMHGL